MNFKKFGIVIFTVLFVGVACLVPCFAQDFSDFDDYGISFTEDEIMISGMLDISFSGSFPNFSAGTNSRFIVNEDTEDPYFAFVISSSDNPYYFTLDFINCFGRGFIDDGTEFDINSPVFLDSGSQFYVYCYLDVGSYDENSIFINGSVSNFPENFSVYDPSGLIGIIGNIGTLIFSSPILIVLFFIGVTCSLGFVVVRFIRKVMWSN